MGSALGEYSFVTKLLFLVSFGISCPFRVYVNICRLVISGSGKELNYVSLSFQAAQMSVIAFSIVERETVLVLTSFLSPDKSINSEG